MAHFERIRDVVSGPFSPSIMQQRMAAGWQLVSIEWRRELPGDEAPSEGAFHEESAAERHCPGEAGIGHRLAATHIDGGADMRTDLTEPDEAVQLREGEERLEVHVFDAVEVHTISAIDAVAIDATSQLQAAQRLGDGGSCNRNTQQQQERNCKTVKHDLPQ